MSLKARPVSIFTVDGDHVADYRTVSAAAEALNLNQGNLSSVLCGRFAQHRGYVARNLNQGFDSEVISCDYKSVPVIGFDPKGVRHYFDSMSEASKASNPNATGTHSVHRSVRSPVHNKRTCCEWCFFSVDECPKSYSEITKIKKGRPRNDEQ